MILISNYKSMDNLFLVVGKDYVLKHFEDVYVGTYRGDGVFEDKSGGKIRINSDMKVLNVSYYYDAINKIFKDVKPVKEIYREIDETIENQYKVSDSLKMNDFEEIEGGGDLYD